MRKVRTNWELDEWRRVGLPEIERDPIADSKGWKFAGLVAALSSAGLVVWIAVRLTERLGPLWVALVRGMR